MRILVACDAPPFPLTNGQNLRIHHYVRQLSGQHVFDLLCLSDEPLPDQVRSMYRRTSVLPPFPPRSSRSGIARLSISSRQLIVPHPPLAQALTAAADSGEHDLFWFSGGGTMNPHYARRTPMPAVLADVVDSLALTQWREVVRARGLLERLRHAKRFVTTCLFERSVFRQADRALFVSEADAHMFERVGGSVPADVIHNGVDEFFFSPPAVPQRAPVVAFEGHMGFGPNVEAARWLCGEVMPLVWAHRPEVRVLIVGKDPVADVRTLAGDRVEVTGTVDDIRPMLQRAAVFACPMQTGAGIKNKILQAWAMGMPTVATPMSTGGLDARDGQNVLVRESVTDFAAGLLEVLADTGLADRIGGAARQTIVEKYSWARKASELSACFDRTLAAARP